MPCELFKRAIVSFVALGFVFSARASGDINGKGEMSLPDQGGRCGGGLYGLVRNAPYILVGQVEQLFGFDHESTIRLFRVTIEEPLKGDVREPAIYLVEPLPSDASGHAPPVLFPARYLLFLFPVGHEEAVADLQKIEGTAAPHDIYSVYADWKGAVSLDSKWRERSNSKIEAEHGCASPEEVTTAVRALCDYMRAPPDEKQKLAEQFRQQGGMYGQFIDAASTEKDSRNGTRDCLPADAKRMEEE